MSSTSDAFSLGSAENHPFKVPIVYWDQPPVHVPQAMCTTSVGVVTGGNTGEMVVWKWTKSEEPRPTGISKNNQVHITLRCPTLVSLSLPILPDHAVVTLYSYISFPLVSSLFPIYFSRVMRLHPSPLSPPSSPIVEHS